MEMENRKHQDVQFAEITKQIAKISDLNKLYVEYVC